MVRLITIGVVAASCLLIWKGGLLNSVLPQPAPPPLDPGPIISKSGDAMQSLKSVHLSLNGTMVLNGVTGVKVTGSGDLIYPHKENPPPWVLRRAAPHLGVTYVELLIAAGHLTEDDLRQYGTQPPRPPEKEREREREKVGV